MRPEQRHDRIIARLRAMRSELGVDELAKEFHVSALTLRRDLEQLEKTGAIVRTHGGCLLRTSVESAYHKRGTTNFELKQAIGSAAAKEVKAGDVILINDGSTPFHLAAHLGGKGALSVYTNSVAVVTELSRFPAVELFILGGQYDSEMHFMGGSMTEQLLESLYFDLVFMGADSVDLHGSLLVSDPGVARLTQIMLRRGRRKVLMADHTKVAAQGHAVYANLSELDVWYTTAGIDPGLLRRFEKMTMVHVVMP